MLQVEISTPKLEKSTSSHTLDSCSIISEESDSSPKDSSTSTGSAIPPMPIRKMKDLTEDTNLNEEKDKFPKSEVKKDIPKQPQSPELTGFKKTGDKVPQSPTEPTLTKEELKNRELEKVQKEYAEKQKQEKEKGATPSDTPHPPATPTETDTASIASSASSRKSLGEEKKPSDKLAGLASLTADLKAVEGEAKAQMKVPAAEV